MATVTNADIMRVLEDDVLPQVKRNTDAIADIRPKMDKVENHELVIYGDRENRRDEGMLGVINNIETLLTWVKPVSISIITACLFWVGKSVWEAIMLAQSLQ